MSTTEVEMKELLNNAAKLPTEGTDVSTLPTNSVETQESEAEAKVEKPTPQIESLQRLQATEKTLTDIKANLHQIIQTIADNPSMINRAATAWGDLPLLYKVGAGVVLSGPLVIAGLLANVASLLMMGALVGTTYTAGGLALDDHASCNKDMVGKLETGVISMANLLGKTIASLVEIRNGFAEELEKFKEENTRLADNVDTLHDEVQRLIDHVELCKKVEEMIRTDVLKINEKVKEKDEIIEKQTTLLTKAEEDLLKQSNEYKRAQQQLTDEVEKLEAVKTNLEIEIAEVKVVSDSLVGMVNLLNRSVTGNAAEKAAMQQQLNALLNGNKDAFSEVNIRVQDAEKKLADTQIELKVAVERYQDLLTRHEAIVKRMEDLFKSASGGKENNIPVAKTLAKVGAFAHRKELSAQNYQPIAITAGV